ncbi:MAG: DUF1249 domain-containing protein [Proteobacteria bacterium]|nr:MAG: DUF1249 domain-containing protein [Pseudomonadota bacterium]
MMLAIPESDVNCPVSWRARPGSFVSLMSLYESNYIRLAALVPPAVMWPLAPVSEAAVSHVPGDCPLHLRIEDRSRYTTTLTLTYLFEDDAGTLCDPDLRIRVYHDARLAEAHACARWHRHAVLAALRSELARALGERWLRNMMLNKWLDYCAERGHRFAAALG